MALSSLRGVPSLIQPGAALSAAPAAMPSVCSWSALHLCPPPANNHASCAVIVASVRIARRTSFFTEHGACPTSVPLPVSCSSHVGLTHDLTCRIQSMTRCALSGPDASPGHGGGRGRPFSEVPLVMFDEVCIRSATGLGVDLANG